MTTKKLLLVIVIFVILAAYYVLGTGYLKGKNQNAALAADIEDTTLLLLEIPSPPADLEERLEAVQNELDSTLNRLPAKPNTTQIIDYVLNLGESNGVKIIPVITQSWETESYDGYDVDVFRFSLSVLGDSSQFLKFFSELENEEFETLIIQNLQIYRDDDSEYLKSISSGSVSVRADIQLAVYGRVPDEI
jgi:hypothetical protein